MSENDVREAQCVCGQLKVRLNGGPTIVSSCSCQACQRRTGAAYGVQAFFNEDQVTEDVGQSQVWVRTAESGNKIEQHFCPECGGTVWWKPLARPNIRTVAAGAFADKHFPAPQRMVYTDFRAEWVQAPPGAKEYPGAPG